jgi:signal transduction histidine kinase
MLRLVVVAAASIGLILFVAFVVSRLLGTRTRGMSIRMQVFLALAVIVGAFAFGLGVMVIDRIESRAVRLATQAAQDEAAAIAGIMAGEMDRTGSGLERVSELLDLERRRGADLRMVLLDADGHTIFPRSARGLEAELGAVAVDAPIVVRGVKCGSVRVVKPTVVMRNLLADMAPTVLVISLVLGAAAALAAAWIGGEIAQPIFALAAFSERVSTGERSAAPPPVFGREVMRLSRALDSMRRQLEGRPFVETFAADLSHELKNPVAAIRASAEVLEDSALEEPEQARRFVLRIREAAERIERLLSELLSLARIEARGAGAFEPIDVSALAIRAIEATGDASSRVRLRVDGEPQVRGDSGWLLRAVSNLVDNALAHSPPETKVEIAVNRRGHLVELWVENEGEISTYVRERLFRRFVTTRGDKGGTGLGLAIVRAVAEAHGGQVELANPGAPVRFCLSLPAARSSRVIPRVTPPADPVSLENPGAIGPIPGGN